MTTFQVALVSLLVSAVLAGPTGSRDTCVKKCDANQKFNYEIGKQYLYNYVAQTETGVSGTFDETSNLKVTARAVVQAVSQCDFVLSLSDVSLEDSSKSEEFAAAVEKYPLRFAWNNGVVDNVCHEYDEKTWVLNFKKGVLSTFQNSMNNIHKKETLEETDVSGVCETTYTSNQDNGKTMIQRHKTPSSCKRTPQKMSQLSSFGYQADSILRGLYLVPSGQSCKQQITDIVVEADCAETHFFTPFSKQKNGAYTKTITSLTLSNIEVAQPVFTANSVIKSAEMIFEVEQEISEMKSYFEISYEILSQLEKLTQDGISKDVARLFSEFVTSMKHLTYQEITSLFQKYRYSPSRKFLVDAMPLIESAASMRVVADLITEGLLTNKESDIWFTALAFIKKPTLEMIRYLRTAIETRTDNKVLLGVSSLIHNYCTTVEDCDRYEVRNILVEIESRIPWSCKTSTEREKTQLLMAIKAIGNIGHLIKAESKMQACQNDENVPMDVRIAAIDAYRRMPCEYNRQNLIESYKNKEEDDELRIASYLAVMECPTKELISIVREKLQYETVNQVGSFVWTHLSNMQETAAKEKQWIRHLIGEEVLQKKFNTNALKFSRNFESSFFLKEQDVGGSVESNVVFSEKSYLPRSAMLGLTVDLFGETVNLFEVGGRIEGFEEYVEKFFGPDGYYPEETVKELLKNLREDKGISSSEYSEKDAKGSYYLKMFGNELFYEQFQGIESFIPKIGMNNIMEFLYDATHNGVDFMKSYQLANVDYNIPTVTGLPLTLSLKGSATVGLKVKGDFDFRGLSSFNLNGKIQPSATIQIDASMGVDAFVTKSGMKLISNLHTSTEAVGKLTIEKGKLIDFELKNLKDQQEIFDFSNEFFKIEDGEEIQVKDEHQSTVNRCLSIYERIGMKLCYSGEYSIPGGITPYFPLNRHIKSHLYLKKTDSHNSYVFRIKKADNKFEIIMDMPGSSTSRKWMGSYDLQDTSLSVDLDTPFGTLSGLGKFEYVPGKSVISSIKFNDYEALFEFELNSRDLRSGSILTHSSKIKLEVKGVNDKLVDINYFFKHNKQDKTTRGEIELAGRMLPPVNMKFSFDREPHTHKIDFTLTSPPFDAALSTAMKIKLDDLQFSFDGSYRWFNDATKSIHSQAKFSKELVEDSTIYRLFSEVKELDMKLDWEVKIIPSGWESSATFKFDQNTIEKELVYLRGVEMSKYLLKFIMNVPKLNLNVNVDKNIVWTNEYIEINSNAKINANIDYTQNIKWTFGKEFKNTYDYTDKNTYDTVNERKISNELTITSVADGYFKIQAFSNYFGNEIKLEGSFQNQSTRERFDVKLEGNLGLMGQNHKLDSSLSASKKELIVKGKLNIGESMYYVTAKADPHEVIFDTNIYKTVSAKAKLLTEGEKRFEMDVNYENENLFKGTFSLTNSKLEANFNYKNTDTGFLVEFQRNNVQFKVFWSPKKLINIHLEYTFNSFSLTVDTPLDGFEKQTAKGSFTNIPNKFEGLIAITWQNTHHFTATISSNYNFSYQNTFDAALRVTSSVNYLENLELSAAYSRNNNIITAGIDGKWNSKIIKAKLNAQPVDFGYDAIFTFVSPFTEDLKLSATHNFIAQNYLSTTFEYVYGKTSYKISFKADGRDPSNMNASLNFPGIYLPYGLSFPKISANGKFVKKGSSKHFEINGKFDEKKFLFNGNCNTEHEETWKKCRMSINLVSTSGKVFEINFSTNYNKKDKKFTSHFDMTPLFFNKGVKANFDGKFTKFDSYFTFDATGPVRISISFDHELKNKHLMISFNSIVNAHRLGFTVSGELDLVEYAGLLTIESESTVNVLNKISLSIEHTVKDSERVTVMNIDKDSTKIKIYHSITFQDIWNWNNVFIYNDIYTLKENMVRSTNGFENNLQYTWYDEIVEGTVKAQFNDYNIFDVTFASRWTSLLKFNIAFKNWRNEKEGNWKFTYGHERDFEIGGDFDINRTLSSVKLSAYSPRFDLTPASAKITIENGIDVNLNLNEKYVADLSLKRDKLYPFSIKMEVQGEWLREKSLIEIGLKREFYYKNEFIFNVNILQDYRFKFDLNVDALEGVLKIDFKIPFIYKDAIEALVTYNLKTQIAEYSASLKSADKLVKLDSLIKKWSDFEITLKHPDGEGKLSSVSTMKNNGTTIDIDYISPIKFIIDDAHLKIVYDFYDQRKIEISGNVEKMKFESLITFNQGKVNIDLKVYRENGELGSHMTGEINESPLGATFMLSFIPDNYYMRLSYEVNFSRYSGDLTANTEFKFSNDPIKGALDVKYSFENLKLIDLKLKLDEDEVNFFASAKNPQTSSLGLEFAYKNTFHEIDASLDATFYGNHASGKVKLNEHQFKFTYDKNWKSGYVGSAELHITSNIPNWRDVTLKSGISFEEKLYSATFEIVKEGESKMWSAKFKYDLDSFEAELNGPVPEFPRLKASGKFKKTNAKLDVFATIIHGDKVFNAVGLIDFISPIPTINLSLVTPYSNAKSIVLKLEGTNNGDERKFEIFSDVNGAINSIILYSKIDKYNSVAIFEFNLPVLKSSNLAMSKFDLRYDLNGDEKEINLTVHRDGNEFIYSAKGQFERSKFDILIETPFDGVKHIRLDGNIYYDSFSSIAYVGNEKFSFKGDIPSGEYTKFHLYGTYRDNKITFKFFKEGDILKPKEVIIEYVIERNNAYLKINTPLKALPYFAIGGFAETQNKNTKIRAFVHKNEDKIEFIGDVLVSQMKFNVKFNLEIPQINNETYKFDVYYDFISEIKGIGADVQIGEWNKKLSGEFYKDGVEVFVKIATPFKEYKKIEMKYRFEINYETYEADILYSGRINEDYSIALGLKNIIEFDRYNDDYRIKLQVITPFENYKLSKLDVNLSLRRRIASAALSLGTFNFEFDFIMKNDYVRFLLDTPWMSKFEVKANYKLAATKEFNFYVNFFDEDIVKLNGSLFTSLFNSKLTLNALRDDKEYSLVGFYNMMDDEKIINIDLKWDELINKLLLSYELNYHIFSTKFILISPIPDWNNIKLIAHFDFEDKNRIIELVLQKNEHAKWINLKGTFKEDFSSFYIEKPFNNANNFKVMGSLNRSKRSIEFRMMNDHHSGGVIANFNSFKMEVNTPFKQIQHATIEISKSKKGDWKLDYKRNERFVSLSVKSRGKKGYLVNYNAKIPGWLPLAMHGLLDQQELLEYLRMRKTIGDITAEGSGKFSNREGSWNFKANTPFESYATITAKMDYNTRRGNFKYHATSSSSNEFHIILECKNMMPSIDVVIPFKNHPSTKIKGSFSLFKSTLTISSRFNALKSFSMSHKMDLTNNGQKVAVTMDIERNGFKYLDLDLDKDFATQTFHFMVIAQRQGSKSMLHIHREAFKNLEIVFNRNGKEFKLVAKGTGNLPLNGQIDTTINNSFREVPITVTSTLKISRDTKPKKIEFEIVYPGNKAYTAYLTYNINLGNLRKGDFDLRIVTPTRDLRPWQHISGNWAMDSSGNVIINYKRGPVQFKATGLLGITKGKWKLESPNWREDWWVEWSFTSKRSTRNYYLKAGHGKYHIELKLSSKSKSIFDVNLKGTFMASRFMKNELKFSTAWKKSGEEWSATGNFKIGSKNGSHKLEYFRRNAAERSAEFKWNAQTNIPGMTKMNLDGKYSLAAKSIDVKLQWDTGSFFIKGAVNDFSAAKSRNSLEFRLPLIGDGELTFSHDFTNSLAKSISVRGFISNREVSYTINWKRNASFTVFDLTAEIKSQVFGVNNIKFKANYDITNFRNANGMIEYSRNNAKNVSVKWSRVKTSSDLSNELVINTDFPFLPTARVYFKSNWQSGYRVESGIEWNRKAIEAKLSIGNGKASASVTSPFPKFQSIKADLEYEFTKSEKSVVFKYVRGDRVIDFIANLKGKNPKKGSIDVKLTTPFDVVRQMSFNGSWKKGNFKGKYQRNNIKVDFDGTAQVEVGKSSFNIGFTPPGSKPVNVEFSYDLNKYLEGKGKVPKDIFSLKVEVAGQTINLNGRGLHTFEKESIQITGTTSFDAVRDFSFNFETDTSMRNREGMLEVKVNDFFYKMTSKFETRKNGFYLRLYEASSLYPISGVLIGVGKEGDSAIITVGFGDEGKMREMTFTFKGKGGKGFSGKIDLPRLNIFNVKYDVNYNFKGENKLSGKITIGLKDSKEIKISIDYDSTGVKSRLLSPWTGDHSLRFKRSISDQHFKTDIGFDNYGLTLEGGYRMNGINKQFKIEGEILGHQVLVDTYFGMNGVKNTEARLMIESSFFGPKKYGFYLKIGKEDNILKGNVHIDLFNKYRGKMEINTSNKIDGNLHLTVNDQYTYNLILDLQNSSSVFGGTVTLDTPEIYNIPSLALVGSLDLSDVNTISGNLNLVKNSDNLNERYREIFFHTEFNIKRTLPDWELDGKLFVSSDIVGFRYDIGFSHKKENEVRKFKLNINDKFVLIDFSINLYTSSFKLDSSFNSHNFGFELNTSERVVSFYMKYDRIGEFKFEGKDSFIKSIKFHFDSPSLTKFALDSALIVGNEKTFKFNLKTTRGDYIFFTKISSYNIPINAAINMEFQYPYTQDLYKLDFKILNNKRKEINFKLMRGTYTIAKFSGALNFEDYIHLAVEVIYNESPHLISINLKRLGYEANFMLKSRFIPIETFGFDYVISPNTPYNAANTPWTVGIIYGPVTAGKRYSASLNLQAANANDVVLVFNAKTPYENYEIGATYLSTDVRRMSVTMSPFGIDLNAFYGIKDSAIIAGLKAKTGFADWENTGFDALIPLNKFAPKVSATFAGKTYGINFEFFESNNSAKVEGHLFVSDESRNLTKMINYGSSVTTMAPYEFKIYYDNDFERKNLRWAIMFDSSFFSLFNAQQVFLS